MDNIITVQEAIRTLKMEKLVVVLLLMVVCVVITLQNFIQREVLKHHIICKCK